jgi:hypothetical protein
LRTEIVIDLNLRTRQKVPFAEGALEVPRRVAPAWRGRMGRA